MLSPSIGSICGIFDIFLVDMPGESTIGQVTDKWFENRTKDFAKMCGWNDKGNGSLKSAITCLERRFDIPYDQVGTGDAGKDVYDVPLNACYFDNSDIPWYEKRKEIKKIFRNL